MQAESGVKKLLLDLLLFAKWIISCGSPRWLLRRAVCRYNLDRPVSASRYVSTEIADKLIEQGSDMLGGAMVKCTVLFSDIRSFTSISERIGPVETVRLLNDYFSIMVDIVLEHHGILDKARAGRRRAVRMQWLSFRLTC